MKLKNIMQNLWNDERGQSTTEYILILSVVVMVALKFKGAFQKQLGDAVTNLGGKIQEGLNDSN